MSDKDAAYQVDRCVGARVREYRVLARKSQQLVAAELGVSPQQVQKYESGANRISASKLWQLSGILGVPVSHLFGAVNDEETQEPLMVASPLERQLLLNFRSLPKEVRHDIDKLVRTLKDAHGSD